MFKIIMLFGLLFSFMPMFIFGQSKPEDPEAETKTDSVVFSVKGMTCGGCVANVKGTMGKVEGITQCEVNLENARADIKYDPAQTDPQKIEKALKSTGFSIAEIKRDDEESTKEKKD
jgi:copper chaperone CopZ